MKKIALITALILFALTLPSVFADDAMQAVLTSVKERAQIPQEYTEFDSDIYTNDNRTTYNFRWNLPDDAEGYASVYISADSDGTILLMESYDGRDEREYRQGKKIPCISEGEAEEIASKSFARLNPNVFTEFKKTDIYISYNSYNVTFTRMANSIQTTDTANISIDAFTGKVTRFYMNYTNIQKFDSPSGILDLDGAKKSFKNGNALQKIYRTFGEENEARIVYQLSDFTVINAKTGEKFKYSSESEPSYSSSNDTARMESAGKEESAYALTEKEISVLDEIDGLMSVSELEKNLRKIPELGLGNTRIEYTRLVKRGDGKYVVTLYFADEKCGLWVSANAKSGQLISFSGYRSDTGETQFDDNFIQKYCSDYAAKTVLKDDRRVRIENGIEFPQNGIYARKDKKSGYIDSFSLVFYDDVTFANPDVILSDDEAYTSAFEYAEPNLKYVFDGDRAVLVYTLSFDYFAYIDAVSGKRLNYAGEEQTRPENSKYEYFDISGHYGEEAINALASISVGFEGGSFEPDSVITQMDFASLVSQCVYDYVIYRNGICDRAETAKGCITYGAVKKEEYYPNEPLSREKAVEILLKAMGYEQFASIEGIFKTNFADGDDISPELLGYAAIASGLKIVQGSGGYFRPKENITRAQAAVMLYNYLRS